MYLPGLGGYLPGLGGCTCPGGCTCLVRGGVPGSGGCTWSRGVYLPGPRGGVPGQVLPPAVDRHTLVKILPWPKLRFGW